MLKTNQSSWSYSTIAVAALLSLAALPARAQGGSTCTLCNPGGHSGPEGNSMTSHVTVAEGRLTFTTLTLVNRLAPLENGVYFLRYGVSSRLDLGVGYWADPGKPRPAVNWQIVPPLKDRPAVLVGYGAEPVGEWKDDGAYVSLVKGFGPRNQRVQAFLAYFREIDGGTNHLMGGVSRSFGPHWSVYAGRYPFNTWDGAISYQLSPQVQLGLWVCDFARSPRLGIALGTGWSAPFKRRAASPAPETPILPIPDGPR
jgi:hypothetical protein